MFLLIKINKERKIKETTDSRYIYQRELDKDCFQHGMAYGDFKNLNRNWKKLNLNRNTYWKDTSIPIIKKQTRGTEAMSSTLGNSPHTL